MMTKLSDEDLKTIAGILKLKSPTISELEKEIVKLGNTIIVFKNMSDNVTRYLQQSENKNAILEKRIETMEDYIWENCINSYNVGVDFDMDYFRKIADGTIQHVSRVTTVGEK